MIFEFFSNGLWNLKLRLLSRLEQIDVDHRYNPYARAKHPSPNPTLLCKLQCKMQEDKAANQGSAFSLSFTLALYFSIIQFGFGPSLLRLICINRILLHRSRMVHIVRIRNDQFMNLFSLHPRICHAIDTRFWSQKSIKLKMEKNF